MAGETGLPGDEAGSGVEPPIEQRVRRALGLLERFAPAIGSRWAIELWCTPPAVEMSLRMPPGVPPGEPVEATWAGHRIAGESWGEGPPVYLVHGWGGCRAHLASSSNLLSRPGTGSSRSTCPATTTPNRAILRRGARRSSNVPKRYALSCVRTGPHTRSWRIPSAPRPPRWRWPGVPRPTAWCSWRRWATSLGIWTFSRIAMVSGRAFAVACIAASTDG